MAERTGQTDPVAAAFMTRAGRTCQEQGNVDQAMYLCFNVIDRYPETKEAQEACDRLLEIAQEYEENGQPHMAKHLYQRIDDAVGLQTLSDGDSAYLRLTA